MGEVDAIGRDPFCTVLEIEVDSWWAVVLTIKTLVEFNIVNAARRVSPKSMQDALLGSNILEC